MDRQREIIKRQQYQYEQIQFHQDESLKID